MEKYNELKELVNNLNDDITKAYTKKNSAAGVRVRVAMQKIKLIAQEIRVEISNIKKEK